MKIQYAPITLALFFVVISLLTINSSAQISALDQTFGGTGKVFTDIGIKEDKAYAMAIQPDGKIVVAGFTADYYSMHHDFALARYNMNGSLDSSFNNDGIVSTSIGFDIDMAYAVAIQADGKIVAAGKSGNSLAIARYHVNGSLDSSFDNDGMAIIIDFEKASSVAIQSDAKIVVAGVAYNDTTGFINFAVARFNIDGSLDSSFDADGKLMTQAGFSNCEANAIALQSDGKIVVSGVNEHFPDDQFATVRYHMNGSLDSSFDSDGIITTSFGMSDAVAYSNLIQPDGKIIVAGCSQTSPAYSFALARYNTNGSLDSSFDADGKMTTNFGSANSSAYSIALQSDGKIIAAGSSAGFTLSRYNSDGSLDSSFDIDGKIITPFAGISEIHSVAIQTDGKILAAGESFDISYGNFALARYSIIPTSIDETNIEGSGYTIYPNPFNHSTNIQFNSTITNCELLLYSLEGKVVKRLQFGTISAGQIITLFRNDFPSGLYFLTLTQETNVLFSDKIWIVD